MQPIGACGLSPSRQLGTVGAMLLATVLAAAHPAAAITYIVPSDGSMVDRTGTIVFGRVLSAASVPMEGGVLLEREPSLRNDRVTSPGGETWTHTNEAGTTAPTRSDTSAFSCR